MRFQSFDIKSDERRLLVDGHEVFLGARALDLLIALAERYGQVVSKQTLMDVVWPDVVVEENNLQVQISTLRKLLGTQVISTVPGRGYCLAAEPLAVSQAALPPLFQTASATQPGNLPETISKLYGREADVRALIALSATHRLITITGSGGVGKTHLAQKVAGDMRATWPLGVWWLDVTTANDARSLVESLGRHLRVRLLSEATALTDLICAIQSQPLLLILDNCEHLQESVRQLVTALLSKAPQVQILATSQTRLQVPGECVYQLDTLAVPSQSVSVSEALTFGSIELFVQRVQQLDRHFVLLDSALPDVIAICQQLDGVALAIELAAARVPMLGVSGVCERLGDRLSLLGSMAAQTQLVGTSARQTTMRATLDWSHHLLSLEQASMYRHLSVFVGSFSLLAAKRLLCDERLDEWTMLGLLESLIQHSLVVVEGDTTVRYRLLETHRLYAFEKLEQAQEVALWRQRLVQAMFGFTQQLVKERDTPTLWENINHIRSAYHWAAAQPDDANRQMAIALATASAMPLLTSGLAHEAKALLLQVEPWVNQQTPPVTAARYWQWLGRVGVHGRLPSSRCVDAFITSEKIFQTLNDARHLHACRRMRAEALLDNDQLTEASAALQEAQVLETPDWPVADRMRRIKVQAMLASKEGQDLAALRLAQEALSLAQIANIERYVLAIQLDIANMQFKMGEHEAALEMYRSMTSQSTYHHYHRVTIAEAYVGFVTILMHQDELRHAAQVCLQSLPYLREGGIFCKHGDVMAWWLIRVQQPVAAARMLGAANHFFKTREIMREPITKKSHTNAMQLLAQQAPPESIQIWLSEGAGGVDERELASSFERTLQHYLTPQ